MTPIVISRSGEVCLLNLTVGPDNRKVGEQVVVNEIFCVIPALKELRVQTLAKPEGNLLVGLSLIEARDFFHRAKRRPPGPRRVALDGHGDRKDKVGKGDHRRSNEGVSVYDKRDFAHVLVGTRHLALMAGKSVAALGPEHLDRVILARDGYLARLEDARHGIAVRRSDEVHALIADHPLAELTVESALVSVKVYRRISRVDVECVMPKNMSTRLLDVAADGHKVAHSLDPMHRRRGARVEHEAPLDSTLVGVRVHASRADNVLDGDGGDCRGPFRRVLLHVSLELIIVRAPAIDELMIDKVFVHDDVQPCQGDAAVRAGMRTQPVLRVSTPPGENWVD